MPTIIDGSGSATFQTPLPLLQGGTGNSAEQRIGVGQTWQNMLASRAMATTYTNSTGRPITVSIRIQSGGLISDTELTIGGVIAWSAYNGVNQILQPYGIVPAGGTYSLVSGSSQNRDFWSELR